jgi:phosphonate transport system substrate-binding protein
MQLMLPYPSRRLFLLQLLLLSLAGCSSKPSYEGSLIIGVVSYDAGEQIMNRYQRFRYYLSTTLKAHVEIEPTFNEIKALERIQSQAWNLVFAPPGVAAIAISEHQYAPLFPQQNYIDNLRSILVIRQNSSIRELKQLQGQSVALGQVGSATGYYFPIYNLYGLTLAEVLFAPTPKTVLDWVDEGKVTAGALSTEEFKLYGPKLSSTFRILYTDSHLVPPGVVLLGPTIARSYQEQVFKAMKSVPPNIAQEADYTPNGAIPNYDDMISMVKRVRTVATHLQDKPVRLLQ